MSINNLNTYLNIRDAHLRVVSGNVYAQAMNIGGINVETAHGLQSVSNTGNATSLTLEFANVTTGFVTTANAQIGRDLVVTGNTTVSKELTVTSNAIISSNLNVSDDLVVTNNILASNNLTVAGNLNVTTVMSDSNVVTEYTGPHDRPLRKYPEVAMTSDAETVSGYKGYKISASADVDNNSNLDKFRAFNGITGNEAWASGGSKFTSGTGEAIVGGDSLGNVDGQWLKLELPLKIKLSHIKLTSRDISGIEYPKDFQILGSNDDSNWTQLINVVDAPYTQHLTLTHHVTGTVDSFQYLAVVVTKTHGGTGVTISELEYYGHEEGSASLDTTLKSVYNVPATTGTQLEVYYDGQDFSGTPASITDRTTNNITATANNITIDTTYNSFEITSSPRSNIIADNVTFVSGDEAHTYALWVRLNNNKQLNLLIDYRLDGGTSTTGNAAGVLISNYNQRIQFFHQTADIELDYNFVTNTWYHITCSYSGGGNNTTNSKIFINGVEQTNTFVPSGSSTSTLTLPATGKLTIGDYLYGSSYGMGDGNIGNVRLYSKALNADQVKELYDYQKDYFLGSKSQVTLYKGHLGVGVTEPSGQLELAGDERIQEYPPRAMTGYETYIEGHGVFGLHHNPGTGASGAVVNAFNKSTVAGDFWYSSIQVWTPGGQNVAGPFNYTGTHSIAGISGEWVYITLPYHVNMEYLQITARNGEHQSAPNSAIIIGSSDGGTTWEQVGNWSDKTSSNFWLDGGVPSPNFTINSTKPLNAIGFVVTEANGWYAFTIGEIKFFGTPGPTTLDKGSLSLTRSLDVPRISRYDVDTETPRPEKLLVDFDTTVNSSPTDISGKGNHGVLYDAAYYSAADKAFKFDGNNDTLHVASATGLPTGDAIYTISCWIKTDATQTVTSPSLFYFGTAWTGSQLAGIYLRDGNKLAHDIGSTNAYTTNPTITAEQWHHIAVVKRGTGNIGANTTYQGLFVDGVEITQLSLDGSPRLQALGSGNMQISIGHHFSGTPGSGGDGFKGCVSKPQIYSVALEPSEIKKLYNLGRTGRSMVISDTAVGIGKAPEAQLDVRGNLNVDGIITSNNPAFHVYRDAGDITTSDTVIVWNQVRFNRGGCYDSSTGIFHPPVDGMYYFSVFGMSDAVSDVVVSFRFEYAAPNGTFDTTTQPPSTPTSIIGALWPYQFTRSNSGTTHGGVSGSFVYYLEAGSQFRVLFHGTELLARGNSHNGFSGFLIG